jgi:hypothetical protein
MSESVPPGPDRYHQDGLIRIHNDDFMDEEPASGVMEKSQAAADSGFYVVGSQSVRSNLSEYSQQQTMLQRFSRE